MIMNVERVEFDTKEWANNQLRYAILILQEKTMTSTPEGRIEVVLFIKRRLERYGYWWQAKRIDNWIHRYKKQLKERRNAEKLC